MSTIVTHSFPETFTDIQIKVGEILFSIHDVQQSLLQTVEELNWNRATLSMSPSEDYAVGDAKMRALESEESICREGKWLRVTEKELFAKLGVLALQLSLEQRKEVGNYVRSQHMVKL